MYSTPSARPHINIFFGGTVKSRGSPLWRGLAILPPEARFLLRGASEAPFWAFLRITDRKSDRLHLR